MVGASRGVVVALAAQCLAEVVMVGMHVGCRWAIGVWGAGAAVALW